MLKLILEYLGGGSLEGGGGDHQIPFYQFDPFKPVAHITTSLNFGDFSITKAYFRQYFKKNVVQNVMNNSLPNISSK